MPISLMVDPTNLSLMVSVSSPSVETAHGLVGLGWSIVVVGGLCRLVIRRSVDR